jgi:hypothetical protein
MSEQIVSESSVGFERVFQNELATLLEKNVREKKELTLPELSTIFEINFKDEYNKISSDEKKLIAIQNSIYSPYFQINTKEKTTTERWDSLVQGIKKAISYFIKKPLSNDGKEEQKLALELARVILEMSHPAIINHENDDTEGAEARAAAVNYLVEMAAREGIKKWANEYLKGDTSEGGLFTMLIGKWKKLFSDDQGVREPQSTSKFNDSNDVHDLGKIKPRETGIKK